MSFIQEVDTSVRERIDFGKRYLKEKRKRKWMQVYARFKVTEWKDDRRQIK